MTDALPVAMVRVPRFGDVRLMDIFTSGNGEVSGFQMLLVVPVSNFKHLSKHSLALSFVSVKQTGIGNPNSA